MWELVEAHVGARENGSSHVVGGLELLTPDLFLPAALADCHHVLLELPTVTAHKAHSSVTEI